MCGVCVKCFEGTYLAKFAEVGKDFVCIGNIEDAIEVQLFQKSLVNLIHCCGTLVRVIFHKCAQTIT